MKNGNFYNFQVPELGDRPDITQVSNALLAVEGITASSIEYITATVSGSTLVCNTNISDYEYNRLKYVEDKVFYLVWDKSVLEYTAINSISIDGLSVVNLNLNTNINNGDVAYFVYDGSLFNCTVMNLEGKLDKGILPPNITTAEDMFKIQVSNAGAEYDEDNLYIENSEIKKAGFYYMSKTVKGLFYCKTQNVLNYIDEDYYEDESNRAIKESLRGNYLAKIVTLPRTSAGGSWSNYAAYYAYPPEYLDYSFCVISGTIEVEESTSTTGIYSNVSFSPSGVSTFGEGGGSGYAGTTSTSTSKTSTHIVLQGRTRNSYGFSFVSSSSIQVLFYKIIDI